MEISTDIQIHPLYEAGCRVDDSTDDTVAFQRAVSSGVQKLVFPEGTMVIGNASGITGVSSQTWEGAGVGLSKVRCSIAPAAGGDFIYFNAKNNFNIRGISFDGGGFLTRAAGGNYPDLLPVIHITGSSYFKVVDCEFIGFHTCGLLVNASHNYKVKGNFVTRTGVMSNTMNYGISCPGGVGNENYCAEISGNELVRCDIGICGNKIKVSKNDISGWGFSSGIDLVVSPTCHSNTVTGNTIYNSNQAPDRDNFYPCGIENWAKDTVIKGNVIFGCFGDGIENGGRDCVISGNKLFNNGSSGIYNLYQDSTYNASGTVVTGNSCTGNGGYGIREQSALLTGIRMSSNGVDGNVQGRYSILGATSYEDEGTFSTTVFGGSVAGVQNTSVNAFEWQREGRKCTVEGKVTLSSLSGTGQVRIEVPFVARNSANFFGTFPVLYSGFSTSYVSVVGVIQQGQDYFTLSGNLAAATGMTSLNMSDISAGATFIFSASYLV